MSLREKVFESLGDEECDRAAIAFCAVFRVALDKAAPFIEAFISWSNTLVLSPRTFRSKRQRHTTVSGAHYSLDKSSYIVHSSGSLITEDFLRHFHGIMSLRPSTTTRRTERIIHRLFSLFFVASSHSFTLMTNNLFSPCCGIICCFTSTSNNPLIHVN
jgi:hypothetical protein